MSILTAEYNAEAHRKVYAREQVEEAAIRMLKRGTPVEIVVEDTNLDEATVLRLKHELERSAAV